jgi:hypothetical protein
MTNLTKTGSSETIRKTTLSFSKYKEYIVSHKKPGQIDTTFLEWFVGFSEGDGRFIVSQAELFFILYQKEEKVLHRIRTQLGFGKVSTYKSCSRFIVAGRDNIERLIHLFNGNLVVEKTSIRFKMWLQAWNLSCTQSVDEKQLSDNQTLKIEHRFAKHSFAQVRTCDLLPQNQLLCLDTNAWFSGFTDANGIFNTVQTKDSRYTLGWRVRLRFILDYNSEKVLCDRVKLFLGSGVITQHKIVDQMYRFSCTSLSSHQIVVSYFTRYPLQTIKRVSFLRFASLLRYINNRASYPWEGKILKRVENLIKNNSKIAAVSQLHYDSDKAR